MKYLAFMLLFFIPDVHGESFDFLNTHLDITGYASYTYSTEKDITNYTNTADMAANIMWSNNYGNISAQISNNKYNTIRRLLLDIPLYTQNNTIIDIAGGRLTNPIGLINTNIMRSGVNGTILYPLSVYDPRRYNNMPDIADGVQLTGDHLFDDVDVKLRAYYGKQVFDNPVIDVYGNNFSLQGDSKHILGFDAKITKDNEIYHAAYTHNKGWMTSTQPSIIYKFLDHNIDQKLYFLGYSNTIDDLNYKIETSYRDLNLMSDVFGVYGKVSYNFLNNWTVHSGLSYGTRIQETSKLTDEFIGISNKIKNITISTEFHCTQLNNWNFNYHQPDKLNDVYALFSIAYSFK